MSGAVHAPRDASTFSSVLRATTPRMTCLCTPPPFDAHTALFNMRNMKSKLAAHNVVLRIAWLICQQLTGGGAGTEHNQNTGHRHRQYALQANVDTELSTCVPRVCVSCRQRNRAAFSAEQVL